MKSKLFLTLMLLLSAVGWARAQEELTVYDAVANDNHVPAYMFYWDDFTKSQFVIPAEVLTDMAGGTISSIKFYTQTDNIPYTSVSTVDVFLMEVASPTISAFASKDDATIVYQGTVDIVSEGSGGSLTITFSTPFVYEGGNLLIGFENTTDAGYKNIRFLGESGHTGCSGYGSSGSSLDGVTFTAHNFLPTTTFSYIPPSTGCEIPTAISVSNITNVGATVTWESEGEKWNLRYKVASDAEWTLVEGLTEKTYTFENLDENTSYAVGVQTDCTGSTSSFRSTTFTTANPCAAPTNLQITDVTSSSATLSWTPGYQETAWVVRYKKSTDSAWMEETVNDSPTFVLSNLDGGTTYSVQVLNCESFVEGTFSTAVSFPYLQDFSETNMPAGWARYSGLLSNVMDGMAITPSTAGWSVGTNNGALDGRHLVANIYGTTCTRWIVSPSIPLESNARVAFDVAYTAYSGTMQNPQTSGSDDKFVVLLSTDNMATWTILRQWDNAGSEYVLNDLTPAALHVAFDLSDYAGQNVNVAFYAESTASNADNNIHVDNVSFELIPSCEKPLDLTVNYTGGSTAEVSWISDADAWNIDVNGTVTAITENPYTLTELELGTTYEVKIQANCGNSTSEWTNAVSFNTDKCLPEDMCQINYELTDSYGDGWNGAAINVVDVETGDILASLTLSSGASLSGTLSLCAGSEVKFVWVNGNYDGECSFTITDINDAVIVSNKDGGFSEPVNFTVDCTIPDCIKPRDVAVMPLHNSATVSWTGFSDSYNVQYRKAEGLAASEESFFDDFESGELSGWTALRQGEGTEYTDWQAIEGTTFFSETSIPGHSGTHMIMSRSWSGDSYSVDNWLITPQVALDGSLSYWVMDDGTYHEHYDVYVCTGTFDPDNFDPTSFSLLYEPGDASSTWTQHTVDLSNFAGQQGYIAFRHTDTDQDYLFIDDVSIGSLETVPAGEWMTLTTDEESIEITDLETGTEYECQVQGVCDDSVSEWSEIVSFTTLPENLKVFVKAGEWNVDDNWSPAGAPTADDNISILADAIIPAGVIAEANNVTIDGGSITIKDGGQLIQATSSLPVTIEKNIAGYGESTGRDCYRLICTPTSSGSFSTEVEGLLESDYDYYRFLQNQTNEWRHYDMASFDLTPANGFLYANKEDQTLVFSGSAFPSNERILSMSIEYTQSTNSFDGWYLVGNIFTCDAYLLLIDNNEGGILNADFFKLNAAGDGFDYYPTYIKLAPGEAAFIHTTTSGSLYFCSYDAIQAADQLVAYEPQIDVPFLPRHGVKAFVDADLIKLADDADNSSLIVENAQANFMLEGRTLYKDGSWNTLAVPFNVTLDGTELAGAIAKTLEDATIDGTSVTLSFGQPVETLEAGVPYIIKWESGEDLVNPVFDSYGAGDNTRIITATEGSALEFANGNVSFIGYYNPFEITAEDEGIYYMKADNTLAHTAKPRTLKAFRAYFEFSEEALEGARSIVLDLGDGNQATSISSLPADMLGEGDWYTVSGMKVGTLKKGVYINNGKKVVIK